MTNNGEVTKMTEPEVNEMKKNPSFTSCGYLVLGSIPSSESFKLFSPLLWPYCDCKVCWRFGHLT